MVLGCTGQDGSILCKSLLRKNHKVIGVSRSKESNSMNLEKLNIEKDLERTNLNLLNQNEIEKIIDKFSPETIFNLSAQSSVGKSFTQPQDTFRSISLSTQNILEACRVTSFKNSIFFAGSSEIFGSCQNLITLQNPKKPVSPYGIAKTHSYELVKLYREVYNLNCKTGILFNHESILRSDQFVFSKIIQSAIKSSIDPSYKVNMGNLNIERDWGWAEDYIEAIKIIANSENNNDYLICSGKGYSLKSIAKKTFSKFNLKWEDHIQINSKFFRPTDIQKSIGNPGKLYRDHKWKASTDIDQIITKLIDHFSK